MNQNLSSRVPREVSKCQNSNKNFQNTTRISEKKPPAKHCINIIFRPKRAETHASGTDSTPVATPLFSISGQEFFYLRHICGKLDECKK